MRELEIAKNVSDTGKLENENKRLKDNLAEEKRKARTISEKFKEEN